RCSARRNASRARARWAFSLSRVLQRRRAGARCALRSLSMNGRPSDGPPRGGARGAVPLSGRVDPPFPAPQRIRRDDACGRFPPRVAPADERRDRGAAFRLAFVISAVGHLFRLARAGFVFAREGVLALADPAPLPAPARLGLKLARLVERPTAEDASVRLSAALTRLGPTYVKLGQFLATRPDVVGPALARDLESLQDKMPPFPQGEAVSEIEAAFGKSLNELFTHFGPAVAAASIAQVHRADAASAEGQRAVAVKVLRPGIAQRFNVDLDA